ncbi:MAG: class IV adenylate cyclase [Chloroflexota bacterium]
MPHVNVEIKARCADLTRARATLLALGARLVGPDYQLDTYFQVPNGRLKLREGQIENNLIFYTRPDQDGPKRSDVILYGTRPGTDLKALLTAALGTLVAVEKRREIYFVEVSDVDVPGDPSAPTRARGQENVKVHLDTVTGLGSFVEIEAIDLDGSLGPALLEAQCRRLMARLNVQDADLEPASYSDLPREQTSREQTSGEQTSDKRPGH